MRFSAAWLPVMCLIWISCPVSAQKPASLQAAAVPASALPPLPTMGWIFSSNGKSIPSVVGEAPLNSTGNGEAPLAAKDGAGNIDGAALVGASISGEMVHDYTLPFSGEVSLSAGTTVVLLCGRENNWLPALSGGLLPVEATGTWNVSKPNEWGISFASGVSPFAVVVNSEWVHANAPPAPASFVAFGSETAFPPAGSNAPLCVWGFYDTSVNGTASEPQISVAYDDGAASVPVTLSGPVTDSPDVPHAENSEAESSGQSSLLTDSNNALRIAFDTLGADLGSLFIWQGAAAKEFFVQPLRQVYWNDGIRRSVASGFQTPPWNGLIATALDPNPVALGGDALDNVWAVSYGGFVRTTAFAHYSITTSPGTPFLVVRYRLGNSVQTASSYSVSFTLDGASTGYDQPWFNGTNLRTIPLPLDGKSHTLELRNGYARSNGNYAAPTTDTFGGGGFIDAVAVPSGYTVQINHPEPASVAVVLSHSVAVADEAGTAPYQAQGAQSSVAWPVLARFARAFGTASVVDESYGGQLLANDCWTEADCASYLATLVAAQPNITVGFAARMLNDFYHGPATYGECLPQYEKTLQNLFEAWHAALPAVPLYVGSDIRESPGNEDLTDGCTPALHLAEWRAGIQSTVQSYASANNANWLHFVDMSNWVPQNDLTKSGLHPTVKGQLLICQAVAAKFNPTAVCDIPR